MVLVFREMSLKISDCGTIRWRRSFFLSDSHVNGAEKSSLLIRTSQSLDQVHNNRLLGGI